MSLNDMKCRTAKPKLKPYKLFDGDGLFLQVMPNGAKYWRMKYRLFSKEKLLSLGVYPEVSLAEARDKAAQTRQKVREGQDPSLLRLEQKQLAIYAKDQTFEKMAMEWHKQQVGHWSLRHAQTVQYRLEKYIFSELGTYPKQNVSDIFPKHS